MTVLQGNSQSPWERRWDAKDSVRRGSGIKGGYGGNREGGNKVGGDEKYEQQVIDWLEAATNAQLTGPDGTWVKGLETGLVLCRLINLIKEGTIANCNNKRTMFAYRDNYLLYNKAVVDLGVPTATIDWTSIMNKQTNLIVHSIAALARYCERIPSTNIFNTNPLSSSRFIKTLSSQSAPSSPTLSKKGYESPRMMREIPAPSSNNVEASLASSKFSVQSPRTTRTPFVRNNFEAPIATIGSANHRSNSMATITTSPLTSPLPKPRSVYSPTKTSRIETLPVVESSTQKAFMTSRLATPITGPDHSSLLQLDLKERERDKEISDWISIMTGTQLPVNQSDWPAALRNGHLLCRLANRMVPGSIKDRNAPPSSRLVQIDDLRLFLVFCQAQGVPPHHLFHASDLSIGGTFSSVLECLLALKRISPTSLPLVPLVSDGRLVQPSDSIKRPLRTEHVIASQPITPTKQETIPAIGQILTEKSINPQPTSRLYPSNQLLPCSPTETDSPKGIVTAQPLASLRSSEPANKITNDNHTATVAKEEVFSAHVNQLGLTENVFAKGSEGSEGSIGSSDSECSIGSSDSEGSTDTSDSSVSMATSLVVSNEIINDKISTPVTKEALSSDRVKQLMSTENVIAPDLSGSFGSLDSLSNAATRQTRQAGRWAKRGMVAILDTPIDVAMDYLNKATIMDPTNENWALAIQVGQNIAVEMARMKEIMATAESSS